MKKSIFLLAAAAAAFASCTQNEVMEVAENRAIGFSSFVGKPTKAVINSASDLTSFNVFGGYSSLTNNFNDVVVTGSTGSWSYTNTQYWEAEKTYKFQAYAGATTKATPTNNGVEFEGFVATGELDLLASDVVTVTTDASAAPQGLADGKVDFSFRHVLSMIKFTFSSTLSSNVNITISDLTVKQLNNTGDYTLSAANTGTWDNLSNPFDYEFTTNGSFASPATKESSQIIVIPQTIAEKTVQVTFTLNATGGLSITDATHTVTLPAINWQEGYCYNYTAELTADNITGDDGDKLSPIEFGDPEVDPWENTDGGAVNFPEP